MKRILLALVMMCGSAIAAEYKMLTITNGQNSITGSISVEAGDVFVYVNAYTPAGGHLEDISMNYSNGEITQELAFSKVRIIGAANSTDVSAFATPDHFRSVVGPCTLSVVEGQSIAIFHYKIIRASESESSANPINIISLPADNNGDVDLLIETSADLQSWTPIYSDSIGATGTASFIRTRLINN